MICLASIYMTTIAASKDITLSRIQVLITRFINFKDSLTRYFSCPLEEAKTFKILYTIDYQNISAQKQFMLICIIINENIRKGDGQIRHVSVCAKYILISPKQFVCSILYCLLCFNVFNSIKGVNSKRSRLCSFGGDEFFFTNCHVHLSERRDQILNVQSNLSWADTPSAQ